MTYLGPEKLTLSYAEKEKRTGFIGHVVCLLCLWDLEPAAVIILNIPNYLSTFGQLFDLKQII